MSQMADVLVLSTGGTTRLIDRLVEVGWVERQNCPTDRRAIFISLTAAGEAKLDEALAVHTATLEAQLCKRLTCDDRRALTHLLGKLNVTN